MAKDLEIDRVKELWGSTQGTWRAAKCTHWVEHPKVRERMNRMVSGKADQDRFQYFIEHYFRGAFGRLKRQRRVLTLGCGHGEFERGLSKYKFARIHEAVDISDGAIMEASRLARAAGLDHIRYRVADLNNIELPKCTYDVVFGISAIHHVTNLEHLFLQVVLSLKPGGYFFLDEYIGPNKFQCTDEQERLINEQLVRLPIELKLSITDGSIRGGFAKPSQEQVDAVDPSEAIRSEDILKILPHYFDIVEVKGYGGTLLHFLLEHIAGNFVEDDGRSMEYLQSFFDLEDELLASGRFQHDFAVIIARRKPTRVQKILGRDAAYLVSKTRALLEKRF